MHNGRRKFVKTPPGWAMTAGFDRVRSAMGKPPMRTRQVVIALVMGVVVLGQASAQEAGAPNVQFEAEQQAAREAIVAAEKRLNAGERGPDSEPCKLMGDFFLHTVKAAVAAGAKSRIADWSELTWQEQDAVKEWMKGPYNRNLRLRQFACTDRP
jgi:hypothetical protein